MAAEERHAEEESREGRVGTRPRARGLPGAELEEEDQRGPDGAVGEGEKSIADLNRIHERYPDKPVILTEFGGAEAQAGWHNWGNVKWSEEYQARNVTDSARYALEQDWLSGGCVWQFADARSAPERMLAGRLHGWNGKGIVDAQRNPKLSYFGLQEIFRNGAASSARSSNSSVNGPADRVNR
jgi:hypothetical protein